MPGAFTRVDMFQPASAWREVGYGLACYRFPGLDGRAVRPALDIAEAASEIVSLAAQYPDKPLRLLGYSTGGPIVLTAAAQLSRDIKVAAMCPAVEHGGGLSTFLRGFRDISGAAMRVRSLRLAPVWQEYYGLLWFGRAVVSDEAMARRAADIVAASRDQIVLPDGGKAYAHTSSLSRWRMPSGLRFQEGQLRIFCGMADPVFSKAQITKFAARLGFAPVTGYPDQGHLLFASHLPVFDDILDFFEGRPLSGGGVSIA